MNKNTKFLALTVLLASALSACNSGGAPSSNNTNPYIAPTYDLGNNTTIETTSNSCIGPTLVITESTNFSEFNCSAESTLLMLSIKFSSQPAAYINIPQTNELPSNVTLTTDGANCINSPSNTYSCNFNINANNTRIGSSIELPLNGSLGKKGFIVVNFK